MPEQQSEQRNTTGKAQSYQAISDPVQVSGCFNKQPFGTEGAARRALKRIEKQHRFRAKRKPPRARSLVVYRCPHCGMYHLGRDEKQ